MPPSIGTKQGITYYSECKSMTSIVNPIIDNKANMRFTGFFDEMWNEYDINFDLVGYGLKKTRANKGLILCSDASKCFDPYKGYVGMVLSFPYNITNGIYAPLLNSLTNINEYLLWGVNVGSVDPSFPTIYAKLTLLGIEFTVWTTYGKFTTLDNVTNIYANNNTLYEFVWDATPLDDFDLQDFDATMAIRINGEDVVLGNYPIGTVDLSGLNFCALDTPTNYYNLECTIGKLILGNDIPIEIDRDWHSSSTSSSSSLENPYYFDDLKYSTMINEPTIQLVSYTNVDAVNNYLQLIASQRRFKHMWLPNSGSGNTLSKIDVTDSINPFESARYNLATSGCDPSRTTVVPPGDCWVATRSHGTVTKVGLVEASHCRNTCLNTSTGKTALPYGQDDAVLYYFNVSTGTMRYPSTPPTANGIKVRGLCDDANGNIWVESGENSGQLGTWFKINGDGGLTNGSITKYSGLTTTGSYGAICSYNNNYIWSVRYPGDMFIDFFSADNPTTLKGTFKYCATYGISYARGYVYCGDYSTSITNTRRVIRINSEAAEHPDDYPLYATTFTFTNCSPSQYLPRHFAILTNNDSDIDANRTEDLYINWMAFGSGIPYLGVIRNHKQYADGSNITIDFNTCEKYPLMSGATTTGVGVMYDADNNPFVWILNQTNNRVQAFDPSTNSLVTFPTSLINYIPLGNSYHYNYTNFTGTVDETDVYPISGTAIYIVDGRSNNKWWGKVCLTMNMPSGSILKISASASNSSSVFAQAVEITNCSDISSLNFKGRYLRLILEFSRASQYDPSPTVRSINVEFAG